MLMPHSPPASNQAAMVKARHPSLKDICYLYEAVPAMLWLLHPNGTTDYCNDFWTRYTGLTIEESQNGGWAKAIHPDDLELCRATWAHAVKNSTFYEAELRFRRASDGQYRRHLCRATPKYNRQHRIAYWLGSCVDVEVEIYLGKPISATEPNNSLHPSVGELDATQKALDLLLQESENRLRAVLSNVPGMIYQFEMQPSSGAMSFLYASSGSRALFGLEPEEIVADASVILSMVAPENRPAFYESIAHSAGHLTRWTWEGWAITPSGQRKWITCSSIPTQRSTGSLVWDGLLMDSTAQKLAQIQVEMQRLQLEDANLRLSEFNQKLDTLATHDSLTGLKNRRRFQEHLLEEFQRHTRYEAPLSLMMIDVDKFKTFNDSFGHMAGDEVLKRVARLMKESVREIDFVARYGGEEFVVVLPRTDAKAAILLAERLRCAVQAHKWEERDISISVGLATLPKTLEKTPEQLIAAADQALYQSKEKGRNRVTYNSCFDSI